MRRTSLLAFLLLILISHLSIATAQPVHSIWIEGRLDGPDRYAWLEVQQEYGNTARTIARIPITHGAFGMALPSGAPAGIYRLIYGQSEPGRFTEIIVNGREDTIGFTLSTWEAGKIPAFTASAENKANAGWQAYAATAAVKMDLLQQLVTQYPDKTAPIYAQSVTALQQVRSAYAKDFYDFLQSHKDSWAAAIVGSRIPYFPEATVPPLLQTIDSRANFWKHAVTNDTNLLRTSAYPAMVLEYLHLCMDSRHNESEQNVALQKATDEVVSHFSSADPLKTFAISFLAQAFKEVGNEALMQYVDQHYKTAAQCQDETEAESLKKRLAAYDRMKPGMPAPEIRLANGKGLKSLPQDTIIVMFWATWCPHCKEMMPQFLQASKAMSRQIGIVAISLDDDIGAWQKVVKVLPEGWTQYCDGKKWGSKPADDYNIAATPTFFLLDKNRNIIGKYAGVQSVLSKISINSL